MQKTIIICDRCGEPISGFRLFAHQSNRSIEVGVVRDEDPPQETDGKTWDLCGLHCAMKVVNSYLLEGSVV